MTRFRTQLNRSVTILHPRKSLKYQHIFVYRPVSFYAVDYCTDALCIKDGVKIDPCMGSGHILVYMFDVLVQIYEAYGYSARDAARSIVEHNLYGLDIDERSAQLAYFSVMMKARSYDRRFFSRGSAPKVYAIRESNGVDASALEYFVNGDPTLKAAMNSIMEDMHDAKEYGSIIHVRTVDFATLYARFDEIADDIYISARYCLDELLPLVQVAEILAQKYHTVATNPPYMGIANGNQKINEYVFANYPISKADLYSVFMERCSQLSEPGYMFAMITQQSWMSLPSFRELRKEIFATNIAVNLAQLGSHGFDEIGGEVVSSVAFVFKTHYVAGYIGTFSDLQKGGCEEEKETLYRGKANLYFAKQDIFKEVPNGVVVYDVPAHALEKFSSVPSLKDYVIAKPGMQTSDNERFLRFWFEICHSQIGYGFNHDDAKSCDYKWFPYNKGIGFRKWYGNNDYVVNFYHDGEELKYWLVHNPKDPKTKHWSRNMRNYDFYFVDGITFTAIGSSFSARLNGPGYLFDTKGPTMFGTDLNIICGFVNSVVFDYYNRMLCKQLTKSADSVNLVPCILPAESQYQDAENIVLNCVELSKTDWDSVETSWDFQQHPLVRLSRYLSDATSVAATMSYYYGGHPKVDSPLELCYLLWQGECRERFKELKSNEEELNRIFIDIYGLQDELSPEVDDKDVTVRLADKTRDVKSLISYAVGCMFGRYSLDREGLIYAGGEWDERRYTIFPADKDNIIPICDDEYFTDDIVGRFVEFIRTVYGEATLDENLKFIADALGGKGQPKEVIRNYFLNDFYTDHLKIYQKRPIYWLFDSGRKNGFKCLIYMHRYRPDTIARIRTDYVHEQQARYRTAIADLEHRVANAATSERVKLNKQLTKLQAQADELREYEEKIHHLADQMISIDLDDGVKKNYAIFKDVLAKIK